MSNLIQTSSRARFDDYTVDFCVFNINSIFAVGKGEKQETNKEDLERHPDDCNEKDKNKAVNGEIRFSTNRKKQNERLGTSL